jgi:predicted ATPase/class 3 adenylate cyclase
VQPQSSVTTFLFTDIEGSTELWEREPERMRQALARHDTMIRAAVEGRHGAIVKMLGDGAQAVFEDPLDAVCAAVQMQRELADPGATHGMLLKVRCGLHVGIEEQRDNDFRGPCVNRAARIMATAYGGQVLLSEAVATLVGERLPAGFALRDLGAVRLRGLERPERVYQIVHPQLQQQFPPLRSLEATPNNLPSQVTSFIGREHDRIEVKRLLEQARLLTLLGTGGIGKTRLSLQAAADMMEAFLDGVWLVRLAELTDARLVPQAVATVLGVKPGAGRSVLDAVLKFVADRQLLIVLDNCEHLLGACAEVAAQLLQAGPRVTVLASSREPLGVAGETTYPVRPLAVPKSLGAVTPATLTESEAARLFIERATAVQPGFQVTNHHALAVADICNRLEGIPLAIELAAGRVRALSVERIAERLIDRFRLLTRGDKTVVRRQQTLRASMDWSYELLTEPERALLRRLAVFAGGWTLEAAESICMDAEIIGQDVLDVLTNLVEKSLVIPEADGARYRLLETVRQYAQERLEESGEDNAVRARHLAFYLALAEGAGSGPDAPRPNAWFSRLDPEWSNLLVAFESCDLVQAGARSGLRLAYSVKDWIVARGFLGSGYRLAVEAVSRAGAQQRDLARCRALCAAAELGFLTGFYQEAKGYVDESLAIAREIADRARIAEALRLLGYMYLAHGQRITAREHFEAALELSRELGDQSQLAAALNGLGEFHRTECEPDKARPLYEEAIALDRKVGDRRRLAVHLCNLASVLIETGSGPSARAVLSEALAIAQEIGSKQVGQAVLGYCAALGALHQNWSLAVRFHGAAQMQAERMGYHREPMDEALLPPLIARARRALGETAFASAEEAGRALSYEEAVAETGAWLDRSDHLDHSLDAGAV